MPPDDGGAAFPYAQRLPSGNIDTVHQNPGLSIRDWFGGMALQGLISDAPYDGEEMEVIAQSAYAYADAMLTARKAGQGNATGA